MQDSLLFILLALVAVVIYLIIKQNKNKDEVVPNKETAPENVCILVGFQDVIEVPKKSNIKFRAAATAVK